MCLRWSSLAVRTAANSISNFSFSFKNSLSRRETRTKLPLLESTHPLGSWPVYIWQGLEIKRHAERGGLNYCFCSLLIAVMCEVRICSKTSVTLDTLQVTVPEAKGTPHFLHNSLLYICFHTSYKPCTQDFILCSQPPLLPFSEPMMKGQAGLTIPIFPFTES